MKQTSLGRKLRVLRAERGLTLREASSLTGVTKETISGLERGIRHPHDVTLAKLAEGYGVPVEELLEDPVLAGKAEPRHTGRQDEIRAGRGDEPEEVLTPTYIRHTVLDRDLFERVARGELSVAEAMSLALEAPSSEYDEVLIPRSRLDADAFWAAIEAIKDHEYQMDDLSVSMEDGYVEVGLKARETA